MLRKMSRPGVAPEGTVSVLSEVSELVTIDLQPPKWMDVARVMTCEGDVSEIIRVAGQAYTLGRLRTYTAHGVRRECTTARLHRNCTCSYDAAMPA